MLKIYILSCTVTMVMMRYMYLLFDLIAFSKMLRTILLKGLLVYYYCQKKHVVREAQVGKCFSHFKCCVTTATASTKMLQLIRVNIKV